MMLLSRIPRLTILAPETTCPCTDNQSHMVLEKGEGHCPITLQNCWFAFKSMVSSGCKFKSKKMYIRYKVYTLYRMVYKSGRCEIFCFFVSSIRSSNSHHDLLVIYQHPHFFRSHQSSTLGFHFLSH